MLDRCGYGHWKAKNRPQLLIASLGSFCCQVIYIVAYQVTLIIAVMAVCVEPENGIA
jgi:hypothetical protein